MSGRNTLRYMNNEYEWAHNQNLKKFKGKWIAVINKKIICSGPYANEVVKEAKKKKIRAVPTTIYVKKSKVGMGGYDSKK